MIKLWKDECGAVISTELVLVVTVLAGGIIMGASLLRDSIVSELSNISGAIHSLDQSYTYTSITSHSARVSGSVYIDNDAGIQHR